MLPKEHRLTKKQDFAAVRKHGRSFFSSLFRVSVRPSKGEHSRFAVVVSTKVSKKATDRNRLRRQIREVVRAQLPKIGTGYDVVISVRSSARDASFAKLSEELDTLFKKARLLS